MYSSVILELIELNTMPVSVASGQAPSIGTKRRRRETPTDDDGDKPQRATYKRNAKEKAKDDMAKAKEEQDRLAGVGLNGVGTTAAMAWAKHLIRENKHTDRSIGDGDTDEERDGPCVLDGDEVKYKTIKDCMIAHGGAASTGPILRQLKKILETDNAYYSELQTYKKVCMARAIREVKVKVEKKKGKHGALTNEEKEEKKKKRAADEERLEKFMKYATLEVHKYRKSGGTEGHSSIQMAEIALRQGLEGASKSTINYQYKKVGPGNKKTKVGRKPKPKT